MIPGISETQIAYTGYFYEPLKKSFESGKVPIWKEEEIIKQKFERDKKRIQPIYNLKGKLVERDYLGKSLDFRA